MNISIRRYVCCITLALAASTPYARAADCAVVTIVAPFPAGSTTDTIARALARDLGTQIGNAVIVENKPGAEGLIAAQDVLRAKPDGCRLLFATSGNLSIAPHVRHKPPYDAVRDFTAIADIGRYTYVLYTNAGFPAQTYAQFVQQVRAKPRQYNYATGSYTNVMAFAWLAKQAGLQMTRIPFKGEPPAIQEMIAGRVEAMTATTLGAPNVTQGRLRALAVLGPRRTPLMPSVPTLRELGVAELDIVPWAGLMGPAGMPADITEHLHDLVNQALGHPDVRAAAQAAGFELNPSPRPAFQQLVADQDAVYRSEVEQLGLTEE